MNQHYQRPAADFQPHSRPTLQPGDMPLLFAEQFDVLTVKDTTKAYASAMLWPPGWEAWMNPSLQYVSTYCDAAMQCGVLTVKNVNTTGTRGCAGMLRRMPGLDDATINAWKVFARIGMGPRRYTPNLPQTSELNAGIIISPNALQPNTSAPFNMAGTDEGAAGLLSTWSDVNTRASAASLGVLSSQLYVQLDIVYNPGTNTTTVVPFLSDDGKGFTAIDPNALPANPNAVWTFSERPRSIGLAASQRVTVDDTDDWNAQGTVRLDYLAVFGGPVQLASASEGGRSYFGG